MLKDQRNHCPPLVIKSCYIIKKKIHTRRENKQKKTTTLLSPFWALKCPPVYEIIILNLAMGVSDSNYCRLDSL